MDTSLVIVLVVAFVAVVFALEGGYLLWNDSRGPEVQRLQRRVRMVSAGAQGRTTTAFLKGRHEGEINLLDRLMLALPRASSLDRLIEQSGAEFGISRILGASAGLFVVVLLAALVVRAPLVAAVALALIAAALPFAWLLWKRSARVATLEAQLPDAIELIARAMRAGHAFPAAIQMVGEESPDPLAAEFRIVHDEVSFGLSMEDAFRNLTKRVPSDDMRFFAIAVLLQRETGGNLAEVLGNIARLIRERFKLLGKVRVLAAEGKLSAWILGVMPLAIAAIINVINPKFMALLWNDPVGLNLIYACCVLYVIGALWMVKIIKIRV